MTVHEVVQWYIRSKRAKWAPRTTEQYEFLLHSYCGHVELTPDAIESCWLPLIDAGKERTAQLVYKLIRASCRRAHRYRVIDHDPTDLIEPVYHAQEMRDYWEAPEAKRFLKATEGTEMYLAWLLMMGLGLRRGELLGLRWSDVDMQRSVVRVSRQRYRYNRMLVDAPTKSRTSKRILHLPEIIKQEMLRKKTRWGYVINETPERLRKLFRLACDQAGVRPIPLHGLRHTYATAAVEVGQSLRVVQAMLGHSSYTVTERHYAHVTHTAMRRAADTIADAMSPDS